MSAEIADSKLHLPSLFIRGFRGISTVSISKLSRVTLFTGMNGVGKTTLLDAIRVYAERGRSQALRNILTDREETSVVLDEDGGEVSGPNIEALFYGWNRNSQSMISIGPKDDLQQLRIRSPYVGRQSTLFPDEPLNPDDPVLLVEFGKASREVHLGELLPPHLSRRRRRSSQELNPLPSIKCESLGPGIMDNSDMANFWDQVVLTEHEEKAVQALQLIYGCQIQRVAMIADTEERVRLRPTNSRKPVVRIKGLERPVPLKSLGDGAVRLFGTALALANCDKGFLTIDEAENGIHHSVQDSYWQMVMQTAHEQNAQVFATTHSWDCVVGFARAAIDSVDSDATLVRIEKDGEELRSIEYSKEELEYVATFGIEVR